MKDVRTAVQVSLFYELGSTADLRSDLGKTMRDSYGFGLRIVTASGVVLRGDLAFGTGRGKPGDFHRLPVGDLDGPRFPSHVSQGEGTAKSLSLTQREGTTMGLSIASQKNKDLEYPGHSDALHDFLILPSAFLLYFYTISSSSLRQAGSTIQMNTRSVFPELVMHCIAFGGM